MGTISEVDLETILEIISGTILEADLETFWGSGAIWGFLAPTNCFPLDGPKLDPKLQVGGPLLPDPFWTKKSYAIPEARNPFLN